MLWVDVSIIAQSLLAAVTDCSSKAPTKKDRASLFAFFSRLIIIVLTLASRVFANAADDYLTFSEYI
jgi:hypothetical protein